LKYVLFVIRLFFEERRFSNFLAYNCFVHAYSNQAAPCAYAKKKKKKKNWNKALYLKHVSSEPIELGPVAVTQLFFSS
jgi:hypothetical protein